MLCSPLPAQPLSIGKLTPIALCTQYCQSAPQFRLAPQPPNNAGSKYKHLQLQLARSTLFTAALHPWRYSLPQHRFIPQTHLPQFGLDCLQLLQYAGIIGGRLTGLLQVPQSRLRLPQQVPGPPAPEQRLGVAWLCTQCLGKGKREQGTLHWTVRTGQGCAESQCLG